MDAAWTATVTPSAVVAEAYPVEPLKVAVTTSDPAARDVVVHVAIPVVGLTGMLMQPATGTPGS